MGCVICGAPANPQVKSQVLVLYTQCKTGKEKSKLFLEDILHSNKALRGGQE